MEFLPFIRLSRGKIQISNDKNILYNELLDHIHNEKKVYIYDNDGIKNDKPNIQIYQKLSNSFELWIDAGPRDIGDVVDYLTAGAEKIIIRKDDPIKLNIKKIRELSEVNLLKNIDENIDNKNRIYNYLINDYDGIVLTQIESFKHRDFKFESFIKSIAQKTDLFVYENHVEDTNYWSNLGVKKLLVPVKKIQEFISHAF